MGKKYIKIEKKYEKNSILEEKVTKKWKILINNEIIYYKTDDKKINDIVVAELFMNKTAKK
jgi:hypothetical protein